MNKLLSISKGIKYFVDLCVDISFWGAMILLLLLGPVAFYEVIVRKIGHPTSWTFTVLTYMELIIIWLGVAYTQKVRGHVNVDIIVMHLPRTAQVVVRIFAYTLSSVVVFILMWETFVMVLRSYTLDLRTTEEFLHPIWWIQVPTLVGSVLLFLVLVCQVCSDVYSLAKMEGDSKE